MRSSKTLIFILHLKNQQFFIQILKWYLTVKEINGTNGPPATPLPPGIIGLLKTFWFDEVEL